jgi:hypothetical protein
VCDTSVAIFAPWVRIWLQPPHGGLNTQPPFLIFFFFTPVGAEAESSTAVAAGHIILQVGYEAQQPAHAALITSSKHVLCEQQLLPKLLLLAGSRSLAAQAPLCTIMCPAAAVVLDVYITFSKSPSLVMGF